MNYFAICEFYFVIHCTYMDRETPHAYRLVGGQQSIFKQTRFTKQAAKERFIQISLWCQITI